MPTDARFYSHNIVEFRLHRFAWTEANPSWADPGESGLKGYEMQRSSTAALSATRGSDKQRNGTATSAAAITGVAAAASAAALLPSTPALAQGYDTFTASSAAAITGPTMSSPASARADTTAGLPAETVLMSSVTTLGAMPPPEGVVLAAPVPPVLPAIALPQITAAPSPVPAVTLLGQPEEVAQTTTAPVAQTAAPAASSYTSFWPEDHWGDSGYGGSLLGYLGTSVSLTGLGAGYLLWRSLNEAPHFDLPLRYETFEEAPRGDAVMTVEAFDDDDDTLEYSIIQSLTDDSRLFEIDPDTGEITFISDPQILSPGDGDFNGVYDFTVQAEDGRGETDTQTIELTMVPAFVPFFDQNVSFLLPGSSEFADIVEVKAPGNAPSLNEVSTGLGNDYVEVQGTVGQLGIELGGGEDTIVFNTNDSAAISLDTGDGVDRITLVDDVTSLVIQNFGAFDILNLIGITGGGQTIGRYDNGRDAANHLAAGTPVATYDNGEDSFLLVGTTPTAPLSTIKFEDTIITEDSIILV